MAEDGQNIIESCSTHYKINIKIVSSGRNL